MMVLHISQYCSVGSVGGVERFIGGLQDTLRATGVGTSLLWLTSSLQDSSNVQPGLLVLKTQPNRFAPPERRFTHKFTSLCNRLGPDVVHFHTYGAAEAIAAGQLQRCGIPYLYTYHSPSCSCRRSNLLLMGVQACDGRIDPHRCACCKLQEKLRVPPRVCGFLIHALGRVSPRMREMVSDLTRHAIAFRQFLRNAAMLITFADWATELLRENGAIAKTIVRLQQGVNPDHRKLRPVPNIANRPFVVGYIGRLEPNKGAHVLIKAFRALACEGARLRIIGSTAPRSRYERTLRSLAKSDRRVSIEPWADSDRLGEIYGELSLLAVPSISLETGPFVVIEALSAGLPVLAPKTIGNAHLILEAGHRLVEPNTITNWALLLQSSCEQHRIGTLNLSFCPQISSEDEMFRSVIAYYHRVCPR